MTKDYDRCEWVYVSSGTSSPRLRTYVRLTAFFSRTTWASRHQKSRTILVKPIWVYWSKRQWVAVASAGRYKSKSAPRSWQITMPAPHHSVFYRLDALPATQPTASKHWRQKQFTQVVPDKNPESCKTVVHVCILMLNSCMWWDIRAAAAITYWSLAVPILHQHHHPCNQHSA